MFEPRWSGRSDAGAVQTILEHVVAHGLSHDKREKMEIEVSHRTIGGNRDHLDVEFSGGIDDEEKFDGIEERLAGSWGELMNDPVRPGVLSAELSLASRAVHPRIGTGLREQALYNARVGECRSRIRDMDRQMATVELTMAKALSSIVGGKGAKKIYMASLEHMVEDFKVHVQEITKNRNDDVSSMGMMEKFRSYRFRVSGGDWDVLTGRPPRGGGGASSPERERPGGGTDFTRLPTWLRGAEYEAAAEFDRPPLRYDRACAGAGAVAGTKPPCDGGIVVRYNSTNMSCYRAE